MTMAERQNLIAKQFRDTYISPYHRKQMALQMAKTTNLTKGTCDFCLKEADTIFPIFIEDMCWDCAKSILKKSGTLRIVKRDIFKRTGDRCVFCGYIKRRFNSVNPYLCRKCLEKTLNLYKRK